jgi:ribonuclease P protein component
MLPAKNRLVSKKEFNEVFRRGKAVSNDVLRMLHCADAAGELKVGFSVGVKFSKKASRRNRVKRWLREAVRPLVSRMASGRKVIFLINSNFSYEQMDFTLIKEKVEDLLGKAKLFK